MPSTTGPWQPPSAPSGGAGWQHDGSYLLPGGRRIPPAQDTSAATMADAAAKVAPAQADAQTKLLQNQAARSDPSYVAPMSAADAAASQLGLSQLAESTRAHQAGEAGSAASLAEQAREAAASEGLAQSKFKQTVSDRGTAITALQKLWGGDPSGGAPTVTGDGPHIGSSGGQLPAPDAAIDPYGDPTSLELRAEASALTDAKERGGERLSASMRGLNEMMAERGISGSGIEAANARGLVGGNLSDMNSMERGMIQGRMGRAQQLSDAARTRANSVEDRNFAAQQQAKQQQISALLAMYGLAY